MLNIVICEDQQADLANLLALFRQIEVDFEYQLHSFTTETSLLQALEKGLSPDILFLDIELTQTTGIQLAKIIRQRFGNTALIIFVSSYPEYVFSVFEVMPFDFLRKPLTYEGLKALLLRIQQYLKSKESPIIQVKDRHTKEIHYLSCKDIYFFEMVNSRQRLLQIKTRKTMIETHSRLHDFAEGLPSKEFCQIYRSIFIQPRYVIGLSKDTVLLEGEIALPIGKKYHQQLRNRLLKREEPFL